MQISVTTTIKTPAGLVPISWRDAYTGQSVSATIFLLQNSGLRRYRVILGMVRMQVHSKGAPPMDLRAVLVDSTGQQDIIQLCKLRLPTSDSYDGSVERPRLHRYQTCSSINSISTDGDAWLTETGWNVPKLLGLSDTVRATLSKGKKLSFSELEDLNIVLDTMLVDKLDYETPFQATRGSKKKISFSAIQGARLDRLLADMLMAYHKQVTSVKLNGTVIETGLGPEIEAASSLLKHWQSRFKSEYFSVDKYRYSNLVSGSLRDVKFSSTATDGLGVWVPNEEVETSEVEGSARFIAGDWWINIGCAHRDGIVGKAMEKATTGRFGVTALALLMGTEEDLPNGKSVYVREGGMNEMQSTLITQVGQKIRVLRGFRLKSMRSPRAGVRYDGFYTIDSWSVKRNITTNVYTLRLTLDRVPGQKRMEDILHIPKPSQLDEWNMYEKLERERIRQTEGRAKFDDWKVTRNVEKMEREHWRRNLGFRTNIQGPGRGNHRAHGWWAVRGGRIQQQRSKLASIDTYLPPHEEEMEG